MDESVLFALGLSLLAGLATGVGSLIAFVTHRTQTSILSIGLGFSGGVMIYVSFMELFPSGLEVIQRFMPGKEGQLLGIAAFFGGMAFFAFIDRLLPEETNPHEAHRVEEMDEKDNHHRLQRMGIFTALAVAIHNFPEGMATFVAALENPEIGIAVAGAVALHNIPEGIAVAIPIYFATGSRLKAFSYSFLSGLAEPVGALVGYLLLSPWLGGVGIGFVFAGIAGMMVLISLDELLPAAREYGEPHKAMYGLAAGMLVMAIGLVYL